MTTSIEVLSQPRAQVAEGPHWHDRTGELLWVDLLRGDFYQHNLATGAEKISHLPQATGAVVPAETGGYVAAVRDGIATFTTAEDFRIVAGIESDHGTNRMNDAKVDAAGRLWAGTMAYNAAAGAGALYRIDPDLTVTTVVSAVTLANGLGWSPTQESFYFIDSLTYTVTVFDYDHDTGSLANGRRFADLSGNRDHLPDGLTVDAEGGVWVAVFGGGYVQRFAPDGSRDLTLELPVSQVTSCTFGGSGADTIFITTASNGFTDDDFNREPLAGSIFAATTGHYGTPNHTFGPTRSAQR